MKHETPFWRGRMTAALGLLAALLTLAPAAHAAAVPQELTDAATADPAATFDVIVDSSDASGTAAAATSNVVSTIPADGEGITRRFAVIDGVTAHLSGAQVLALSDDPRVSSILPDVETHPSAVTFTSNQVWPAGTEVSKLWKKTGATIAIVDSGIDTTRGDFAPGQVIAQQDFTGGVDNTVGGDGYGHGTFVAGIAAGRATGYAGSSPNSKLVSLDVFDDNGNGTIGEVIAAADWIYQHPELDIKVANFSLTGSTPSSFINDPLDKAVEALWHQGIVVVAAAGNYHAEQDGVLYAPANDPWVITVGAYDDASTASQLDDVVTEWSARGHTPDGFAKPEVGAPGRALNGPVPVASWMWTQHPEHITDPDKGYFWMSGTSFAAPVVSGAAALLVTTHPSWTPDQIKGALMLTAKQGLNHDYSYGVGGIKASHANMLLTDPPNPNAAINAFYHDDGPGTDAYFHGEDWIFAAQNDPNWAAASWASASWESASWESASWESASWESASWESQTWSDGLAPPGGAGIGPDAIWIR